ncbi:high frequency lysogenization protein HflD [Candidatus Erwinia haradaeae]|uniref:High frequency lysogenization protein HflD homolog n=1 Tax=Candidatus Erwinia haradaeae TaxID=1922217 RepID=A0A451DAR1_9GAMM|nr:high frequency lysogenization protein HflD [Candidatus Erwinia haradaeae]VFP83377.1 High frequency lysogenization protein HflD [Candidatus Erwinia haradaeae]
MTKKYYNITLALAGICQATYLVQQLARYGHCNTDALKISLNSLLNLNPSSLLNIFGEKVSNLHFGLVALIALLNGRDQELGTEVTKYTMSVMVLERKLRRTQKAAIDLANRIHAVNKQHANLANEQDILCGLMAEIYLEVISPLGSRIQVTGSGEILKNIQVQNKIRAMLLAGIRAAVLWQQIGGRHWQLMWLRQRFIHESKLALKLENID